jgi:hypothetical protein
MNYEKNTFNLTRKKIIKKILLLNMTDSLIQQCLNLLHREDVKKEIKEMFKPIISLILQEIYPYIYLSILLVLISFLLILGIFYLLLRFNKHFKISNTNIF